MAKGALLATRRQQSHPLGFWIALIALVAGSIYLPLALTEGYWGDIEIYMAWTYQITHFGIHSRTLPISSPHPTRRPDCSILSA